MSPRTPSPTSAKAAASAAARDQIRAAARDAAERSAKEQGLPARITDEQVLEKVAAIIRPATRGDR